MPRTDPTTAEGARDTLEVMWTIRRFEEALEDLYSRGMLHGTNHLSIGQEAVAAGACGALDEGDLITSTHRGHGHCIAHGADPMRMMAELLGREDGYCRGRGGSMHIADVASGNLGANGIVAGSMTIAVGAALSQRLLGREQVVLCFFGDGAVNEGAFHEALNVSSLWGLPVVYIIENNRYGMGTSVERASAITELYRHGESFGIPGERVDGMDVVAVKAAGEKAVEHARSGEGPYILEMQTYRDRGHSMSDPAKYRTKEEVDKYRNERDPIDHVRKILLEEKMTDEAALKAVDADIRKIVNDAAEFAQHSPEPDPSELWTDVLVGA